MSLDSILICPQAEAPAPGPDPAVIARDFGRQLRAYLHHCLCSDLQVQPAHCRPYPAWLSQERLYRHEALALMQGPLALLFQSRRQEFIELQALLAIWPWQQQAWQKLTALRDLIEAMRQSGPAISLKRLIAARSRLEAGYAECDSLACLIDRLERHGIPPQALKALEHDYLEVLIELGHLQSELEPHWLAIA